MLNGINGAIEGLELGFFGMSPKFTFEGVLVVIVYDRGENIPQYVFFGNAMHEFEKKFKEHFSGDNFYRLTLFNEHADSFNVAGFLMLNLVNRTLPFVNAKIELVTKDWVQLSTEYGVMYSDPVVVFNTYKLICQMIRERDKIDHK